MVAGTPGGRLQFIPYHPRLAALVPTLFAGSARFRRQWRWGSVPVSWGPLPPPISPQRHKRRPLRYQKMRRPMTAEQQLERSVLESKEREELHAIAQAMDIKTTTRSKKADLIDQILSATGVANTATNGDHAETNGGGAPEVSAQADRNAGASSRYNGTNAAPSMDEIEAELDATVVTNGSAPATDDDDGDGDGENQPRAGVTTPTGPHQPRGGE